MARTWEQVYNGLITEKNTMATLNTLQPNIDSGQDLLTDVTTTSKVARWRLYFAVFATGIVALENLQDAFQALIVSLLANQKVGRPAWYRSIALEFQYGDPLVIINNQVTYNPVNTANRIIAECAVVDGNPLIMKLVKSTGGVYGPLSTPELNAFKAYMNQQKFAGTGIVYVTLPPDELALQLKIYYDPLLMDGTGQSLSAPGTYPVLASLNAYLYKLAIERFNAPLILPKLEDDLQQVSGVVNPFILSASARTGVNPFVPFTESYDTVAGYMILNTANTVITYVPYV